jgi:CHAT domain-containing protein
MDKTSIHVPVLKYLGMAKQPSKFMIPWASGCRLHPVLSASTHPSTGSIHEIDSFITQRQQLLSMSFRSDPLRPLLVFGVALGRLHRFILSLQKEDLDKAVVHFARSILLPPLSWLQRGPIILDAFFILSNALLLRSKVCKQPEDAICAAKCLLLLRNQAHEIPIISRHKVTALLVDALAFVVEFEAENVMQNIREMAVLSRELLTLDASDVYTSHFMLLIYRVVMSKIHPGDPDQPLDELIDYLRTAREHKLDLALEGHIRADRVALAWCLVCRYQSTYANDDYKEATSILDEITTYNSQDESVAKIQASAMGMASGLATLRSSAHQTPENVEEALYRAHTCFSSSSYKKHFPLVDFDPELFAKQRTSYFGSIEGLGAQVPSFKSLISQLGPEQLEYSQILNKMESLLFEIRYETYDTTKIDEAIEKGRSILASNSLTDSSELLQVLDSFSFNLHVAFRRTNKIQYLNESISKQRQLIEPSSPQRKPLINFPRLSISLFIRSQSFPGYRTQDLDEALDLLSQYVSWSYVNLPYRFRFACTWACFARYTRHPSVSSAYETALSLMHDILFFSPTLQLQHATLAMHVNETPSLPLDYASYQIDSHQLEQAIETLERGRALLWSEMCHLRISTDQLLEANPDLGHRFAAVNRELEELTKSVPPSHKLSIDEATADCLRAVDPFGRLLLKHRGLLKERAKLISQIQALQSFDSLLTSPSEFDTVRSVASSGPVIIINHSKWRSDILILLHHMPPSLISTSDNFFQRAGALKDKLLKTRQKYGLDSNLYDEALASVLAELYTLVGKPVIDRLRQLQVPEQSRIWWCPTSVFCSLPLHAMGPIPSDDGEPRYFLDLYICSYTPTLSALIQSRKHDPGSRSTERPSVLLVAQTDPSLPTVGGEVQVVQALDTEVTSLISEEATPVTVIDSFHRHQFVHFACHGALETGRPFEAGFELHGDARLTLLEIVRSHIPTAEFAFLSACHTAEVTEGSIMDEGLHLAAAVQYCGFRSVVGTMWAMVDEDGQDLAEQFYKALFSNSRRDQALPHHERSAKALRFAVIKLRRKRRITLERWVNFVHYGA